MKSLFVFFTIFARLLLEMPQQENGNHVEKFVQKIGQKPINRIEITYHKDSTTGMFYGCERLTNGVPIYYTAPLNNLRIGNGQIQFDLVTYTFSKTPFAKKASVNKEHYDKVPDNLPAILKFSQSFSGDKLPNELKLRRTSSIYDSKSDEMTFIRIN